MLLNSRTPGVGTAARLLLLAVLPIAFGASCEHKPQEPAKPAAPAAPARPSSAPSPQPQTPPAAAPREATPAAPTDAAVAAQPPAEPPREGEARRRRRTPGEAPPPPPKLVVRRVAEVPATLGPNDELWANAMELEVPLVSQTLTSPMLDEATVASVAARALTDGRRVAWRLSWSDDAVSDATETNRFSDAAGVQFPLVPGASYMMGAPDQPVHSLYWRASWQRDIDQGFTDIPTLHPNSWADLYWFAESHPARFPASFTDKRSHQWFAGLSAGNPMSDPHRASPVEEVIAAGFGTLTHLPDGRALGAGAWSDGRWSVVFIREIGDDALSRLFAPGAESEFAAAVWDGEAGNVGGRKHHSVWVAFEVER